ncbi:MAG: alpha/beta fold hydrolase [Chloroflexi bacterium]|nr:alpha/beta fold hydrolase [Chloroflexota bacterium]
MTTRRAVNGGVRIAWEEAGAGDPVLLIHGLGYARRSWGPLVAALAERHRVITFDGRGIGDSDVPPGPYRVADMAADAVAVLDAAGVEQAHVVGTSLGGMIAQELTVSWPERVDRLVLLCTTPGATGGHPMPPATVRLMTEAPSLAPEVAMRRFVRNALGDEPDPALEAAIIAERLATAQDPAGWLAQAAAGAAFDLGDRAIGAPTRILTGTADRVVDPRNADVLAERIPGATVIAIGGTGHLFFRERPAEVAALILEHLDGERSP